jgi:hypothetical protein
MIGSAWDSCSIPASNGCAVVSSIAYISLRFLMRLATANRVSAWAGLARSTSVIVVAIWLLLLFVASEFILLYKLRRAARLEKRDRRMMTSLF